ncbi:alpha/beta fold hydrolase [Paenarthrobacter nitroguajacolicus]|uniref:Alpha/beta fold hydrolase n=1 Tax=Paenarthrobacter nitroguajacolicus TaxID=211146 RepID=A0A558GQK2_PAENT|nr:alpha/beta fold hydrolase [Paenarthrobacter nitroguajacolicus]TVU59096.1 alpha/beta fold hydrolase [Paenarthrobacter nitroguajacolicus]
MTDRHSQAAPLAFHHAGHGPNASIGVAICHGFTGSPLSILPWAEYLAGQGFAVSVPLLPGHGTSWQDLSTTRWQDWYRTFEQSYLDLAEQTETCFVAGLSMGGAVALRVASLHDVPGLVLVNPGLSFYDRRVKYVGALKYVMPTTTPIVEDNPAPLTDETGDYSKTPLKSVHELKKLFRAATRGLPRVQAPALVFKSAVDGVIPPSSVATISRHLASSRLKVVTLPHSGHVATLDVDGPTIFEESAAFFRQHAGDRVASESS